MTLRNRIYYPALKRANIPTNIRFHDLRATYATLQLIAGTEVRTVQDQLGHRTARTMLEIYAKVNEESRRFAANRLEAYLMGGEVHWQIIRSSLINRYHVTPAKAGVHQIGADVGFPLSWE